MSSTVRILCTDMMVDLWSVETWCKLKSPGPWDYCDIHNSISVWSPTLAHACVSFITLLLYISDSELEDSPIKTYWKMFINASGLGRSLPLLSDSSPVSFLEKLRILFATWPTSSNCQLLQMRYQTEAYKIRIGFSSTKQLFYTFQYNISPRAFPALNKTI